jgi:hypothetical protein
MGTHALIARHDGDDTYTAIYVHRDGFVHGVGATLVTHYTTPHQIARLMALGNLSDLGTQIGSRHSFAQPHLGWCLAYGRDDGRPNETAQTYTRFRDVCEAVDDCDAEYLYVFDAGRWHSVGRDKGFTDLAVLVAAEQPTEQPKG